MKATSRQTFALFKITGIRIFPNDISKEQAHDLLAKHFDRGEDIKPMVAEIVGTTPIPAKKPSKPTYQQIFDEALAAGKQAAMDANPTPMIVQQHENPLDDSSPVEKSWRVSGGVCGMAAVHFTDGRKSFARWLKSKGYARDAYPKGVKVHCHSPVEVQSLTRNSAMAAAMAKVFSKHGHDCTVWTRMD